MKEVNALGFECPMPVIMAKRVVKEEEENFFVLVDNQVAVENLEKLGKQTSYSTEVENISEKEFKVIFKKSENANESKEKEESYIVVFDSNTMGDGEEEFSKKLLQGFVLALTEQDKYPEYVVCYNKGVELTTVIENTVEDLKKLENAGVEILSCGLCLDNYKLKEELKVGQVTNMYIICELLTTNKVVRPWYMYSLPLTPLVKLWREKWPLKMEI